MRIGFAFCGDPDDLNPLVARFFPTEVVNVLQAALRLQLAVPVELRLDLPNHTVLFSSNGLLHRTDIVALVYDTGPAGHPDGLPEAIAETAWSLAAALKVDKIYLTDDQSLDEQLASLRSS